MGKDRLILINTGKGSKLPPELPPNLVYWIRCETRYKPLPTPPLLIYVETGEEIQQPLLITEDELQRFYKTRISVIDCKIAN
jgi:hypothetical protein